MEGITVEQMESNRAALSRSKCQLPSRTSPSGSGAHAIRSILNKRHPFDLMLARVWIPVLDT